MLLPSEPRYEAPSVQEILRIDGDSPPPAYTTVSDVTVPNQEIPFDRYTSQEFFDLEMERLWPRVWQWVCREEHIPAAGDYYVYDIGHYSFVVLRTESGAIKAYHNACQHRATKLKPSGSEGRSSELRCPFHGWTWTLEGDLKRMPCAWDFPDLRPEDVKLPEARVGVWGGFVFINMDENAISLEEYLAPLPEYTRGAGLEDRYVSLHIQKELACNWKVASEAFVESYHVLETHPQLVEANGHAGQYDIFSDHVNRVYVPSAVPSSHLVDQPAQQEMLDKMVLGDRSAIAEPLVVPAGGTARQVMAQYFRDTIGKVGESDLADLSVAEIIDTLGYLAFPNGHFFPAISFPIIYRFRPIGMDPDHTLFDLILLSAFPAGQERPPPAEPVRITVEESYTSVPGVDPNFGRIYDQDTGNMSAMQEGMKAAKRMTARFAEYQEMRIRHIHQVIDKYLARAPGK
jgi:nitrite reductase/ring-hydroxylating ferredoxin subunit